MRAGAVGEFLDHPHPACPTRELGVPSGTLKAWVFRLRRDYYEAFGDAVRPLAAPEGPDTEVRYLFGLRADQPPVAQP